MQIFAKLDANEGTYEDLYNAFSRPICDSVAEFHPPDEGRKKLSEGFMSSFIGSLGDKWRRESRDSMG